MDKYYTKPEVAEKCVEILKSIVDVYDYEFIEPSAGSGAFMFDFVSKAFDILPEKEGVIKADWFLTKIEGSYALIGNPPFGKRNSLSKAFIKKAVNEECKLISFILPTVYEKHTLQRVFPDNWQLVSSTRLDENSFTHEGNDYSIPCVFQVWMKDSTKENLRVVERKHFFNSHFEIVKKQDPFDFFMFGAAPKNLIDKHLIGSNNRGYCVRSKIDVKTLKENILNIDWNTEGKSSASGGVSWFTKQEILEIYERHYDDSKQ